MRHVHRHDVQRFAQFAVRVWGCDYAYRVPERTALEGIARLEDFFASLGLPTTLRAAGIPGDRLEEMAAKVHQVRCAMTVGNFVKLRLADVLAILRAAG